MELVEIDQTSSTNFLFEELTNFELYPNPSNGNVLLNIQAKERVLFSIELHNSLGQEIRNIYKSEELEKQLSIPIDNLSDGMFFIVVTIGEKTQTKKLVVIK